jgi:hypothetical protein
MFCAKNPHPAPFLHITLQVKVVSVNAESSAQTAVEALAVDSTEFEEAVASQPLRLQRDGRRSKGSQAYHVC